MYCPRCGTHNTDDAARCELCGTELAATQKTEAATILVDLTQFSYRALVFSLRRSHALLSLLLIPLFSLIYLVKKFGKQPFFSPILKNRTPQLHRTSLKRLPRLHKKSFDRASAFLAQHGFKPLIDVEDVSMVQRTIQHVLVDRQRGLYSTLHLDAASGNVTYASFLAFIAPNRVVSVDNTYALPVRYPGNVTISHLPRASLETTYQRFLDLLERESDRPQALPVGMLFCNSYRLRQFAIEQGIQQQLFFLKGTEHAAPSSRSCYYHPFNVAVRECCGCHTGLCEACYTEYEGAYYCQNCLPQEARSAMSSPLRGDEQYAGFGVRSVAALLDMALLGLWIGAFYWALASGFRLLSFANAPVMLPLFLTQMLAVVSTVGYLLLPVKKYGRTPGQKVFGLRIVDQHGQLPETVAVIVRFSYLLLSCLFVFPVLGYLFILFRKTKQGLHDQLAGTFVITRHPLRKALLSWTLLFMLAGGLGWQVYQYRGTLTFLGALLGVSSSSVTSEIFLEPHWESDIQEEEALAFLSFIRRQDLCILSTKTSLQALDIRTGAVVWKLPDLPELTLQPLSRDPEVPLLALQFQGEQQWRLLNIDAGTGQVRWEKPLSLSEPRLVFDSRSILVYNDTSVSCYDLNGAKLWETQFHDQRVVDYAYLHSDVLIGRYTDTSVSLSYLNRETGQILWELPDSPYYPGYVLDIDRQCFSLRDGRTVVYDVPAQKPLWNEPQDIGYAMAHMDVASARYLYTNSKAVRTEDGTTLFSYPENSRFTTTTEDFLVLLHEEQQQSQIFFVDKRTGDVVKQLTQDSSWFTLLYLAEDASTIYLAANLKPEQPGVFEIHSNVLLIDKQTFDAQVIPVGKNLGSLQFTVFPQENVVFIPSYQSIGSYTLPKS